MEPAEKNLGLKGLPDERRPKQSTQPIRGEYWAESPSVVELGNFWMVYFDNYRKYKMWTVRSKDLKNWEDVTKSTSFPEGACMGEFSK